MAGHPRVAQTLFLILTAAAGLCFSQLSLADPPQASTPSDVFKAGLALQNQAEHATEPGAAQALYEKAIDQYRQATLLAPEFYPAQAMWANCLHQLLRRATEPPRRQALATAAQERFREASRFKDADSRLYHDWGLFLTLQSERSASASPEASRRWLEETKSVFEKGLDVARFSGEKIKIHRDLGICLVRLGLLTRDPLQQRALWNRAIGSFEAVAHASNAPEPRVLAMWGVALLQLGKLDGERLTIRSSIERLLTSVELDPENPETRYNLACAYAILDQFENAMRHLRVCLEHDPKGTYREAARVDPDLHLMARLPEFNQILLPGTSVEKDSTIFPANR